MLPISGIEEAPEIASRRRAHSGLVDKALGLRVDGASGAAARRMDIEGAPHRRLFVGIGRRQRYLVFGRAGVIGHQQVGAVDAVQLEQAFDEIGLPAVNPPLGRAQFRVDLFERQPCRQYRVLDVEKAVVPGLQPALLGQPTFGPRIWRIDAYIDDFRLLEAPLAHDPKALAVPVRVGDQVDRDVDAERASEFERLEIEPERHALAAFLQPVFVDGFEPEEYVGHPESLPEPEYLLIAQQNVAAGFQVIALL